MAGLDPAIHVLRLRCAKDVDARHKAGHDDARDMTMTRICRLFAIALFVTLSSVSASADPAFESWLQSLWPQAKALGVSRTTFDNATRGLEPDYTLPDLVLPGRPEKPAAGQPEFVQTPADYIKETSIDRLAADGRKLYEQYRSPLTAIEKQFGTPPAVLLAIYGRETDYGRQTDKRNAIRVLATQAYTGKRKEQFQNEFLLALKILQQGQFKLADMKSSWAGAMGLTQFLPSDYLKYAVDFDGDGKADIWNSVPDALASAANGSSAASCRLTAGCCRRTSARRRHRWYRWRAFTGRRFSPPRTTSSSRNIISPTSTCCSSAISPTASPIRARKRRRLRHRGARSRNCRPPISTSCSRSSPRAATTTTRSTAKPAC
jgi:hypothetical protein